MAPGATPKEVFRGGRRPGMTLGLIGLLRLGLRLAWEIGRATTDLLRRVASSDFADQLLLVRGCLCARCGPTHTMRSLRMSARKQILYWWPKWKSENSP